MAQQDKPQIDKPVTDMQRMLLMLSMADQLYNRTIDSIYIQIPMGAIRIVFHKDNGAYWYMTYDMHDEWEITKKKKE